jgi:YidC/Oxa1 family membrane protein insertase
MLTAIVLSLALVFLWGSLFKSSPPQKPAGDGSQPTAPETPSPAPGGNGGNPAPPGPPPAPAPPAPAPAQNAKHEEFVVSVADSEWLDAGFTTRGGALRWLRLSNSYEHAEKDEPQRKPLDVFWPADPDLLTGDVELDAADTEAMRTTDWTREKPDDPRVVSFSFLTRSGLKVVKTYALPTGAMAYDLDLSISVERVSGASRPGETVSMRVLGSSGFAPEPPSHSMMGGSPQVAWWIAGKQGEPEREDWGLRPVALSTAEHESRAFRFVGVSSHYFGGLLWSEGGKGAAHVRSVWADAGDLSPAQRDRLQANLKEFLEKERQRTFADDRSLVERVEEASRRFLRAWVEVEVPVGAAGAPQPALLHLYAGPLSRRILAQDRYEPLRDLITYPFAPDFVARGLLWIFDRFRGLLGSAGLAIILMTLVVRGGLMPLSMRSQLSLRRQGRKMARVKPKLEVLKAKWAKDPKRLREEQVKLYREHGIGFPMGCLMLLIQMPIFMSLFASLRVEYDLRHVPFLWIHDLSGPDALVDFGRNVLGSWTTFPVGGIRGINLLPLLYVGLSIWQQRLMPKPMDEQQAQQMRTARWMTIIFSVLLYNYTGALALYMVVSTSIAIVESRIVRRVDAHELAREAGA